MIKITRNRMTTKKLIFCWSPWVNLWTILDLDHILKFRLRGSRMIRQTNSKWKHFHFFQTRSSTFLQSAEWLLRFLIFSLIVYFLRNNWLIRNGWIDVSRRMTVLVLKKVSWSTKIKHFRFLQNHCFIIVIRVGIPEMQKKIFETNLN